MDARSVKHDWAFHPYAACPGIFMILSSSRAKKLTSGLICLIVNRTVPLKVIHPET